MKLYYVTTNEGKFKSALAALKGSGIELIQEKMEIPELQSLNGKEIAIASAKYAAEKLQKPIIKNDSYWRMEALNGFPGAYMSYMKKWLTPEDFVKLMEGKKDRRASLTQYFAYCEPGKEPMVFSTIIKGILATKPQGKSPYPIDNMFIPEGLTAPIATLSEKEYLEYWSGKETFWKELMEYLRQRKNHAEPIIEKKKRQLIVAIAIVKKNNQFLICQRASKNFEACTHQLFFPAKTVKIEKIKPTWEFPGGKVDFGETLEQTAIREVLEETNVTVTVEKILPNIITCIHNDTRRTMHCLLVPVLCQFQHEKPFSPTDEIAKIKWVTENELKKVKQDPYIDFILSTLRNTNKNGE